MRNTASLQGNGLEADMKIGLIDVDGAPFPQPLPDEAVRLP